MQNDTRSYLMRRGFLPTIVMFPPCGTDFVQRVARDQASKLPGTSEGEALAPPGNDP